MASILRPLPVKIAQCVPGRNNVLAAIPVRWIRRQERAAVPVRDYERSSPDLWNAVVRTVQRQRHSIVLRAFTRIDMLQAAAHIGQAPSIPARDEASNILKQKRLRKRHL